jgi:hypothetical protein
VRRIPVAIVHGVSRPKLYLKSTLAGRAAVALRRQRRAPLQAAASRRAARRDGPPPAPAGRRRFRAVYVVTAGPGELEPLGDLVESVRAWEGDAAKVIVVDDATPDVRWPAVRARHPDVDVVRARWPTGGPPRLSPPLALGFAAALARYDWDVLCKLDTDALVTGPKLGERAAARFAADPRLGLLGTVGTGADGTPEDYSYDAWVLRHERRWSATVRDRLERARRAGYAGPKVHGGVYVASRAAVEAVAASGDLRRNPPWWSQIGEDLWFSLAVIAAGFRLGSWGAPGEPTASASKWLPVPPEEVAERGLLAVHSVRRGPRGEPEAVVRATLRTQRAPGASTVA